MQRYPASIRYLGSLTPLVLMVSLSLFSIYLVKNSTLATKTTQIKSTSQSNNYYLKSFFISQFDNTGTIISYLGGKSAIHFEQPSQLNIEESQFYFFNNKRQYLGRSNSAQIDDSGDNVQLFDGVEIIQTLDKQKKSPLVFQSNSLLLSRHPDNLISNQPVKIHKDNNIITAQSMVYDNETQHLTLTGNVKVARVKRTD